MCVRLLDQPSRTVAFEQIRGFRVNLFDCWFELALMTMFRVFGNSPSAGGY